MKHILLVIFPVLLASCASQSPRKLYPDGAGKNVFKVGQVYQNRSSISYAQKSILAKWKNTLDNGTCNIKLKPGTRFEIVRVKKEFNGSYGRTLVVDARFYHQGKYHRALVTEHGFGKKKKNVAGFNRYIVPDLSNVRRVK